MREIKFKENLRYFRMQAHKQQCELAQILHVDPRTVSSWENGNSRPCYEILAQLCEIFDITLDSLFFD